MRKFIDDKERTDQFVQAVKALHRVIEAQGSDAAARAYAEATAESYHEVFAKSRGLKESDGRLCIQKLLGRQCNFQDCSPPGGDHDTLWLKDGRPALYLMQPYGLGWNKMRELIAFCLRHGLRADVDVWPSFHFPGHVLSVCLVKSEED